MSPTGFNLPTAHAPTSSRTVFSESLSDDLIVVKFGGLSVAHTNNASGNELLNLGSNACIAHVIIQSGGVAFSLL